MRIVGSAIVVAMLLLGAASASAVPRHGLSAFGDLKYPADFQHFDYVDPNAPKGGEIRFWALDSFDNLNPFILKGANAEGLTIDNVAPDGTAFVYESLMEAAADEPDAMYGLIAATADLASGQSAVIFALRSAAHFHDGTPITSADVAFSFHALVDKGHPRYRLLYRDVTAVEAEGPERVIFRFAPGAARDLPLLIARMPILSRAWFASREFDRTTLEPVLGSGPYRIAEVDPGRSITYARVPDYWGKDLPVMRGRHNFDRIRYEYFRDRDIAHEGFFARQYDLKLEFTSKLWATGYDRPQVKSGQVIRETLPNHLPVRYQAFFLNTRRDKLKDARVRHAINLAFDFEWMDKTLFYGLYQRIGSIFENSDLAAHGLPTPAELALLEPYRKELPPEVFTTPFRAPSTDGSGSARDNLRAAQALLTEAGWIVRDGHLVNQQTGTPFVLEFLIEESTFLRVVQPYANNLQRLGIDARIRLVDVATFQNRLNQFDYDVAIQAFNQPLTPGIEQRNHWGSAGVDVPGSLNFSGINSAAVDGLIDRLLTAPDRPSLIAAARALDRVIMWGWYTVPHFYSGTFRLAYWNRFGRPPRQPRFALEHDYSQVQTWWVDPERARLLAGGKAPPPPATPQE